jgi:hypothetical protein
LYRSLGVLAKKWLPPKRTSAAEMAVFRVLAYLDRTFVLKYNVNIKLTKLIY